VTDFVKRSYQEEHFGVISRNSRLSRLETKSTVAKEEL